MIKASIIVANNRSDYQLPKLGQNPKLEVIVVDSGNPSWARNKGAKQAKGKYLVFLDNDVVVKKGFLDKVIVYLDQHSQVGAGQLKLLRMGSNKFDSAGDLLTGWGFLAERAREAADKGQFDKADKIFSGKGAAIIVRKNVFKKIGGFDASFIYYWEEPDLFWRVWRLGYQVRFLWMGQAWHAYGTKLKPIPKVPATTVVYLSCRNQLKTIIKNAPDKYFKKMLTGVILAWIGLGVLFFIKGNWRQAGAVIKALSQIKLKSGKREKAQLWLDQLLVRQAWYWYLGKGASYVTGKPF